MLSHSLFPTQEIGRPAAADSAGGMRFGEFPITETGAFPPPDAPGQCWVYVTLNAEIALSLHAPGHEALRALIASPRVRVSVDGQWLWWALRRKYPGRPLAKLSGSDLIHEAAASCAARGRRLLLLGSTPERNAAAVQALRRRWPALAVAGYAPPAHEPGAAAEAEVVAEMLEAVSAWRADYLVLGFGAAKEHRLAATLASALDGQARGIFCFGGAIDLASGEVRRAPRAWQIAGLEGLYRVWQQPRRAGRLLRVLRVLPLLAGRQY